MPTSWPIDCPNWFGQLIGWDRMEQSARAKAFRRSHVSSFGINSPRASSVFAINSWKVRGDRQDYVPVRIDTARNTVRGSDDKQAFKVPMTVLGLDYRILIQLVPSTGVALHGLRQELVDVVGTMILFPWKILKIRDVQTPSYRHSERIAPIDWANHPCGYRAVYGRIPSLDVEGRSICRSLLIRQLPPTFEEKRDITPLPR